MFSYPLTSRVMCQMHNPADYLLHELLERQDWILRVGVNGAHNCCWPAGRESGPCRLDSRCLRAHVQSWTQASTKCGNRNWMSGYDGPCRSRIPHGLRLGCTFGGPSHGPPKPLAMAAANDVNQLSLPELYSNLASSGDADCRHLFCFVHISCYAYRIE
jgi:hypothetical protein